MFPPSWIRPVAAAPLIGSFLGVVVMRVRSPGAILWGRSACRQCGHRLGPSDLVPLFSWLAAQGRCRYCTKPVGVFYPGVELAALAVAAWSASVASGWLLWASCGLGWTLLALALIDIRHFLLPDFLTLTLAAAGLLVAGIPAPEAAVPNLIGAAAGLMFVLALRYAYWLWRKREGIGLGDAKLLAASGTWVSWQGLPSVVLIASLSGLAIALLRSSSASGISSTDRVPFGAFLCLGTWLVWLYGPLP